MSEDDTPIEWKGWALGNTALYLEQPPGTSHVFLSLQWETNTYRLAQFLNPAAAEQAQSWLDMALSAVGDANMLLVREIEALHG